MPAFLSGHRLEKALCTIPQSTFVEGASHLHGSRVGRIFLCQEEGEQKEFWLLLLTVVLAPGGKKKKKKAARMSWEAAESRSSSRMWEAGEKDGPQENQASQGNAVMPSQPTQKQYTQKMAHETQT